ncbi:MAG: hypothetical protein KGM42_07885 [Hyphomicrobiales bacterium]|nr:hypothetical protein [Hyphomicrobiales bacterium]
MNDLTLTNPPPGVTAADYEAIEDAVMETARGRWFLLEYARRQRAAETQRLSDAVDRLESAIAGMATPAAAPAPREQPVAQPNETAEAVAERLSDIVWTMRERGVGDQFCAELEKQIKIIRTLRVELQETRPAEPALPAPAPQAEAPPPPRPLELPAPWRPSESRNAEPAPEPPARRASALERLDALPLIEKIALFS